MSVKTNTKNKTTRRPATKARKPKAGARKSAAGAKPKTKTTAAATTKKIKPAAAAKPKHKHDTAKARSKKPIVSVILVTRNDTAALRDSLDALKADGYTRRPACSSARREVFVVDTGGGEYAPDVVKDDYPGVNVFRHPDNIGGARSINMAIATANGEYVLLLDPKIVVSKKTVADMVTYLQDNLHVGAVSAAVDDTTGRAVRRPEVFPSVRNEFVRECGRLALGVGVRSHTPPAPRGPAAVDWVARGCTMIRRDTLRQVGPLDDGYSTYFTEADWCRRARAIGWSVHFHPGIKVTCSPSLGEDPLTPRGWPEYQFDSSRRHYFRKHHGSSAAVFIDMLHGLRQAAEATRVVLQKTRTRRNTIGKALRRKLEQPTRVRPHDTQS